MPWWVPRAIVLFWLGFVAVTLLGWATDRLRTVLLILVAAQFIAFAMEPSVNRLVQRGWRRGRATGVVMLVVFLLTVAFVAAIGSLLVNQVARLIDTAPETLADAAQWVNDTFGTEIDTERVFEQLTEKGGPLQEWAQGVLDNSITISGAIGSFILQMLTMFLFAYYMCADGPRMRRTVFSLFRPERQRHLERVFNTAIEKTAGYLNSRMILAAVSAAFHFVFFTILGLPYAGALAVWVGLVSQFVPTVGTYIAAVLPVVVALSDRPVTALWVVGFEVVYQQVENYMFAPRITAKTVNVHPAVAFGAVYAGAALFGAFGAILAIPAVATVQSVIEAYVRQYEVIDSHLTTDTRRRRRRWRRAPSGSSRPVGEGGTGPPP